MDRQLVKDAEAKLFKIGQDHLLTQMERSSEDGECVYRTSTGLKCVVGAMISDEHYDPELEGNCASAFEVMSAIIASQDLPFTEDSDEAGEVGITLDALQDLHDKCLESHWEEELTEFAQRMRIAVD